MTSIANLQMLRGLVIALANRDFVEPIRPGAEAPLSFSLFTGLKAGASTQNLILRCHPFSCVSPALKAGLAMQGFSQTLFVRVLRLRASRSAQDDNLKGC